MSNTPITRQDRTSSQIGPSSPASLPVSNSAAPVLLRLPDLTIVRAHRPMTEEAFESGEVLNEKSDNRPSAPKQDEPVVDERRRAAKSGKTGKLDADRKKSASGNGKKDHWKGNGKLLLGLLVATLLGGAVIILLQGERSGASRPAPHWHDHVFEPPTVEFSEKSWSPETAQSAPLSPSPTSEFSAAQVPYVAEFPDHDRTHRDGQYRTAPSQQGPPAADAGCPNESDGALQLEPPRTGGGAAEPVHSFSTPAERDMAPSLDGPGLRRGWDDQAARTQPPPHGGSHTTAPAAPATPRFSYPATDRSSWAFHNDFPEAAAGQLRVSRRPSSEPTGPNTGSNLRMPANSSNPSMPHGPGAALDGGIQPLEQDAIR